MLYKDFLKRLFDISVSLIGLVVSAPLFVLVAILLKTERTGAVFFVQQRVGANFKPFNLYKFRSMISDTPKTGLSITAGDDRRITKIGKFLRKTKIDELPQLFNVLKGDMSFVGPRPEVNKYVDIFYNDYKEILKIRPGITDMASIKYRNESDILGKAKEPEKEYIDNISFIYDVALIFKTLIRLVNSGRRL
ncbi:MAG: sugar transferase [Thermodesulfobacteriota bacterium]